MNQSSQEQELVAAVLALDADPRAELAALFGARSFDGCLIATESDRMTVRDWVERKTNQASGFDVPAVLARLRGAIRALRRVEGDLKQS